jgi:Nuclease-related domain
VASWKAHFDAWHQISKTNIQPVKEEGGIQAGRDAEDLLRKIVNENYSFKGCHSFAAKRIPDPRHQRRREIDLIVVTAKRLYVIECKNWTGKLSIAIDGDSWIQERVNGRVKEHEDVLSLNTMKMNLLVEHLRQQGIKIQPHQVCQKLIFMNPKLKIASLKIARNANVITPERLETYLSQQDNQLKTHEQLFSSVIGLLLDEELKGKVLDGLAIERVGGEHHDRMIQEIAKLATWDKIFLHGTKILSGDLMDRSIPNLFSDASDPRQLPLDRAKEIRIRLMKSRWWGLLKAFFKIGRPIGLDFYDPQGKLVIRASGNPCGIICIREAGSSQPTDINLCQIDRIVSGRYIEKDTSRQPAPKKPIKTLLAVLIGGTLLWTPAVRTRLLAQIERWRSLTQMTSPVDLDRYTGNYDFGRYAVKISRQKDRLVAQTANGKARLDRTKTKSGNEFRVVSPRQGSLGEYIFIPDRQARIHHLIWVQKDGSQRKCPKI